jgi:hypothetical protein
MNLESREVNSLRVVSGGRRLEDGTRQVRGSKPGNPDDCDTGLQLKSGGSEAREGAESLGGEGLLTIFIPASHAHVATGENRRRTAMAPVAVGKSPNARRNLLHMRPPLSAAARGPSREHRLATAKIRRSTAAGADEAASSGARSVTYHKLIFPKMSLPGWRNLVGGRPALIWGASAAL